MQLRWKLLILLLLVSLLPVGIMAWMSLRSMEMLGEDLADQMRSRLAQEAEVELRDAVAGLGHVMRLRRLQAEELVGSLAAGIEASFECPEPSPTSMAVWADSFDHRAVSGLVSPVTGEEWSDAFGPEAGSPVSYETPSFFLAGDQSPTDPAIHDEIQHLLPVFEALVQEHGGAPSPDVQTWFVGTRSGLLVSWPGHGDTPAEYDPRKRPWYALAMESDDIVTTPPYIAIAQLDVVLSMVMPIRTPDGEVMGVAGIDLSMDSITNGLQLPTAWGDAATVQIVRLGDSSETLEVIASESYDGGELVLEEWDVQRRRLTSSEIPHLGQLIDAMAAADAGVVPLETGHELELWAFADAGVESTWLLVTVPDSAIFESARAVAFQVTSAAGVQATIAGVAAAIISVVLVVVAAAASRSVTRPIRSLAASAEAVARGDLTTQALIKTRDEIGDLARAFNAMIPRLQRELDLQRSLGMAAEVQQQLLPASVPEFPGWEIAARCLYCDETGGDYYDFLMSGSRTERFCAVVGDVTGHGISAALMMATARATLRTTIESDAAIQTVAGVVNRQLVSGALPGRFMTMFALQVEIATGEVSWVSAGHDPAVLWSPSRGEFRELVGVDLPLAVLEDHEFSVVDGDAIAPGEVVAIMTDGLFECRNAAGEMSGKERLRDAMTVAGGSADEVADAMIAAVDRFRGEVPHRDDVTLVVIRRLDLDGSA